MSTSDAPTTPGRKVIVALGDRSVLGEIVRAEPAPRFGALDRTRLTIRTEPHGVETTALARDVEAADGDGPGPSAPPMDAPV
jgi:hypothetical protein